jgi:DNA transformation protein
MTDQFIIYLLDLLGPLGPVRAKKMFGGYGVYLGEAMFGIVVDDVFYLKVDDKNLGEFEEQGLPAFRYNRRGKEIAMSFFQAPPDAMEEGEILCRWAAAALEAARRSKRKKKQR